MNHISRGETRRNHTRKHRKPTEIEKAYQERDEAYDLLDDAFRTILQLAVRIPEIGNEELTAIASQLDEEERQIIEAGIAERSKPSQADAPTDVNITPTSAAFMRFGMGAPTIGADVTITPSPAYILLRTVEKIKAFKARNSRFAYATEDKRDELVKELWAIQDKDPTFTKADFAKRKSIDVRTLYNYEQDYIKRHPTNE